MSRSTLIETPQDLAALVPQRSRWTPLVIATVLVFGLVAAWFAPIWFNPSLGQSSSGAVRALGGSPYVVSAAEIDGDQHPVILRAVSDLPGARVVGVWVTTTEAETEAWDQASLDLAMGQSHSADATAVVDALAAAGAPMDGTGLPARVSSGDTVWVVWQVIECGETRPGDEPGEDDYVHAGPKVEVQLHGPLGTLVRHSVDYPASPFAYGFAWLEDAGSCP